MWRRTTGMSGGTLVMALLSQSALLASSFQLAPARGLYPASPRICSASFGAARPRAPPCWVAQQIDAAPEGPGLSGWRTNPAVKGVEGGRTVSLPGYYQDEDQMLPKWAEDFIPGNVAASPVQLSEAAPAIAVRIANEEVSWEPYYCKLVGEDGSKNAAAMAIKLLPDRGEMAPRGKSAQRIRTSATDPTDDYKDQATIRLELTREGLGYLAHVRAGGKDELAEKPLYLVIKTEQKTHTWRVNLRP